MSTPSNRATRLLDDVATILPRLTRREASVFQADIDAHNEVLRDRIGGKRLLVTGAAGSIGSATVGQVLRYGPALVAAIDVNENSMVELVRDVRSRPDPVGADALQTAIVDFGSTLCETFIEQLGPFDMVLHFAAMKHVRSERDVFSLSHLVQTNVLKVDRFLAGLKRRGPCDVFAVSSDKACRPASVMGASKRLMEQVVFWHADHDGALLTPGDGSALPRAACARFANVAFSNGSLLSGFLQRLRKRQPLAGPSDVRRYFITEAEAGQLCLLAAALADTGQILTPRLAPSVDLIGLGEVAEIVLDACGLVPRWYASADEARRAVERDVADGHYPCCFMPSDTSGEKGVEEFVAPDEPLAPSRFDAVDIIAASPGVDTVTLREVLSGLAADASRPDPATTKARMIELLGRAVPHLQHVETGRSLDQKM
jgi:FlaA1/EpsC-like NDP-sugar epimerase